MLITAVVLSIVVHSYCAEYKKEDMLARVNKYQKLKDLITTCKAEPKGEVRLMFEGTDSKFTFLFCCFSDKKNSGCAKKEGINQAAFMKAMCEDHYAPHSDDLIGCMADVKVQLLGDYALTPALKAKIPKGIQQFGSSDVPILKDVGDLSQLACLIKGAYNAYKPKMVESLKGSQAMQNLFAQCKTLKQPLVALKWVACGPPFSMCEYFLCCFSDKITENGCALRQGLDLEHVRTDACSKGQWTERAEKTCRDSMWHDVRRLGFAQADADNCGKPDAGGQCVSETIRMKSIAELDKLAKFLEEC